MAGAAPCLWRERSQEATSRCWRTQSRSPAGSTGVGPPSLPRAHFPQERWRKIWRTNPHELLNKEVELQASQKSIAAPTVVGIFPNVPAIVRLVGSQLLELKVKWKLEQRRLISQSAVAKIPQPEELLDSVI